MIALKKLMFDYAQFESISRTGYSIRLSIPTKIKLSEAKLHIKASPLKSFLGDVVSTKRLYMFERIEMNTFKGNWITKNTLPSILELDNDYSIKFSDIAGYDEIIENITIELRRNQLQFEITELWIEYVETKNEPTKLKCSSYDSIIEPKSFNNTNNYKFYFKNNMNSDIKIYKLFNYNDIYYLDKDYVANDYLKNVECIIVDGVEVIKDKELFKPIEEYKGHDVIFFFKHNVVRPMFYIKTIDKM